MGETSSRSLTELPEVGRLGLAVALAAAPVAWAVHLVVGVALVPYGCETGRSWPLQVLNGVTLLGALLGVGAARRLRRAGRAEDRPGPVRRRARFLATVATYLSVLFAAFIVLESVPTLVLDPCE